MALFLCCSVLYTYVICAITMAETACDGTSCPKETPYCTTAGCVSRCPENSFENGTHCVLNCGDGVVDGNKCRDVCPSDKNFTVDKVLVIGSTFQRIRLCLHSCDNHSFAYENTCKSQCPEDARFVVNNTCMATCPGTHPYLSNTECFKECPELTFIHNFSCLHSCPHFSYNKECVANCPNAAFKENNTCVNECPHNMYYNSDECSTRCPEKNFVYNQTCISVCPPEAPYIYDYCLVNSCPRSDESYKPTECVEKCPDSLALNFTCVRQCPHQVYSNQCIEVCPRKPCEVICSNHLVANESMCTDQQDCKQLIAYGGKCVGTCPDGKYWIKFWVNGETCITPWLFYGAIIASPILMIIELVAFAMFFRSHLLNCGRRIVRCGIKPTKRMSGQPEGYQCNMLEDANNSDRTTWLCNWWEPTRH